MNIKNLKKNVKKVHPLLIFALFFILSISFVSADPPFIPPTTQTNIGVGLILNYPTDIFYEQNEPFEIHIHAMNSTGKQLNNTEYDCHAHIYDTQQDELGRITGIDCVDCDHVETIFINETYTEKLGTIGYVLYCTSIEGEVGFVNGVFQITEDSEPKDISGNGVIIMLIFIPLLVALLLILGSSYLDEEHGVLKVVSYLMILPFTWVSFNFGVMSLIRYNGFFEMQNLVGSTVYWMGWVFFALIFYFFVYIIYKAFSMFNQKKKERLNY